MRLNISGYECTLTEVGRNTTDGQAVSSRDCLTGKPVAPYGHILIEWNGAALPEKSLRHQEVKEVQV